MSSHEGEPRRTPAEPVEMKICGACGARVLAQQGVCEACGRDAQLGVKTVAPLPEELFWVQVRAQFQCQRCRHSSPLNHPDVDGVFECVRCHLEQANPPDVWQSGLLFAHAVADLGSPGAESRQPEIDTSRNYNFNLSGLGTSRSSASLHIGMTVESTAHFERHSLQMEASPGHPLCERCSEPLQVQPAVNGGLCTTCPGCGDRATFTLDNRARQLHPGLVGVRADELREDRAIVQLGPVNGREAVAVQCPQCGAALELTARDHFVKCGYCQTPSNVPAKLKRQLFPNSVLVEPWWLLFRGVAPERQHVKDGLLEEAEEEREEAEERQREREERVHTERVEVRKERAKRRQANIMVATIIALGLGGFAAGIAFMPKDQAKDAASAALPAPPRPSAGTLPIVVTTSVVTPAPPPPSILLKDCSCLVKLAGAPAPQKAVLSVRSMPQVAAGKSAGFALAFAINVAGRELELMTNAHSAPPASLHGTILDLALGCSGATVAIASGSTASGWSASTGGLQWSTALPVRYGTETSPQGALQVRCRDASLTRDVMSLPKSSVASPSQLKLRVSDGQLL